MVQTLGYSRINSLLLTAPSYILSVITAFLNALPANRSGERFLHITLPLLAARMALILVAVHNIRRSWICRDDAPGIRHLHALCHSAGIDLQEDSSPCGHRVRLLSHLSTVFRMLRLCTSHTSTEERRDTSPHFWSIAAQRSSPSSWQPSFA